MNNSEKTAKIFNTLAQAVLVEIGLILAGAALLILSSQKILPWLANRLHGKRRLYLLASVPMLRLVIITGALVLIIPRIIEPSIQNMVGLLGTAGVALGFALKDYVSSLIAGIVAVHEMPYRTGDWIQVAGTYGEVTHIGMRAIKIVTPDDTAVFIPHLKLWHELIFNANNGDIYLQCVADFYLHPSHDADRAKHALEDVALTSPFLQTKKPVMVIVQEKPWGTHYRLKAYPIDPRYQFQFIMDMTVRGKAVLAGLGMEFASSPAIAGAAS